MIFTLRELVRWLGLTMIEIHLNLLAVTIFSVIATFKLEKFIVMSWWSTFVPLFICDGLNAYFCVIVFIRQYLEEMKIWTSEHTFQHPWETVTQAAWRKYPNPINPAVEAIDIVDRQISNGVLKTHRLISSKWGLPSWASRLLGADKTCYASEHSEVNPRKKVMTLLTKNLTFCNEVSVIEKLTYSPHPSNKDCTLLKQEAVVTIKNIPLSSYIEEYLTRAISSNANKGRQAMEWVIGKLNNEVQELTHKTVKGMDEITVTAKKGISVVEDFRSNAKKGMNDLNQFAEETLPNLHFEK